MLEQTVKEKLLAAKEDVYWLKSAFAHRSGRLVAGGGIEPPTQGFSVLCSTN